MRLSAQRLVLRPLGGGSWTPSPGDAGPARADTGLEEPAAPELTEENAAVSAVDA